jgi:hypothetical protein
LNELDYQLSLYKEDFVAPPTAVGKKYENCCSKCVCQCIQTFEDLCIDNNENRDTNVTFEPNLERLSKPRSIRSKRSPEKKITPIRNCMIDGGVELVPLLAKRRSQPRPISLGTTDVTKVEKAGNGYFK